MSTLADHGAAIASRYGLGAPTGPLARAARGEQGQVWRLVTDRGSSAVKELLVGQQEPAAVNGQFVVPAGGQMEVPTLR